eukprot:10459-Eustigmatos_ZCMA.PRE.1
MSGAEPAPKQRPQEGAAKTDGHARTLAFSWCRTILESTLPWRLPPHLMVQHHLLHHLVVEIHVLVSHVLAFLHLLGREPR